MNFKAIVLGATLMLSTAADATIFVVQWSGARFGNTAIATGRFDINTAVYPTLNNSRPSFAPDANFVILSMVVSGATAGNGDFDPSDFISARFASNSALDYTVELFGQLMDNSLHFGSNQTNHAGHSGSFSISSDSGNPSGAPISGGFFRLNANGSGFGDTLEVVSIAPGAPSVPEPSSWALLLAGFGIVGVAARRRAARSLIA